MTLQVRIDPDTPPSESMLHPNRCWCRCWCWLFHSLLNIPINYQALSIHPMALLPSIASYSPHIADLFTKSLSLSRHRFTTTALIGDLHSPTPSTSVAVDTVTVATTIVASATASDSVPSLHPNLTLPTLDTGDSVSISPSRSDFLPVAQAHYGLIRSALSVASKAASTPVDPYTLITGEDVSVSVDSDPIDLSSTDPTLASDSVDAHQRAPGQEDCI